MKVIKLLKEHEKELKEKYSVRRIGVFGSNLRGEERETSDIDLLVEFEEPTFDNFMDLVFFLEDLFGKKVDLITPKSISPYISPSIQKEVVWV